MEEGSVAAENPSGVSAVQRFPYSFDRVSHNTYVDAEDVQGLEESFVVVQGEVSFSGQIEAFYLKKKRLGDDIFVQKLGASAKRLFLDPTASR